MRLAYERGDSLATVAHQFGVSRQTVYVMLKRRNVPLRQKPPARPSIEFQGTKYTLRNVGYFGATTGRRSFLHRDVWEHHNGPIPDGFDIHHIDHDKWNNAVENLMLVSKDEHTRMHSRG